VAIALPGRGSVFRVFLLAFIVYAYFMPRWADWNIESRLDLVHAIVDGHTVRIDRYHWNTWDKAVYRGHFYSDKAPGTAVLGAAVYAAFVGARQTPVLGGAISALERNSAWNIAIALGKTDTQAQPAAKGRNLGGCQRSGVAGNVQYIPWGNRLVKPFQDWALSKYVVTAGVDGFLSALIVAFFFWFLGFFTMRGLYRWLLTGLYAVATVALPYSTVFYSHQLAAGSLFAAFALMYLRARQMVGRWAAPVAGFLLGFAFFTEYTVLLVILLIGLYSLWLLRRRPAEIGLLCLAGAVPLAALLAYNYACFGSPFDTGYTHDFCWSSAQAAGFAGFTYPKVGPLFDLTFGSFRGLFYMSPFLLLAAPGALVMARKGFRLEALLCLAIGVLFILAISAYWGWNGGRVDGPRYLVPIVPFLTFPVIFYLDKLRVGSLGWVLPLVAGAWSFAITWILFLGGSEFPTSWLRDPIVQYSLPALQRNEIASNAGFFLGLAGWQSLLPLLLLLVLVGLLPWRYRREVASVPAISRAPSL
jgi:hypothetical protein